MKRTIVYISGSRADYGLMRSVLFRINSHPNMELHIAATGMHLLPEFGNTIDEIHKDGFTCHRVEATQDRDSKESMALFIGCFIRRFVPLVGEIKPDFILLLGDRGEMLGGAIAGAYLGIPVVHIHGGEITGTVDEIARHAITKLSHIHLPATEESAQRIIRMGEDPATVHVVGAPGLEQINEQDLLAPADVSRKYHLDCKKPVILVIQHPVTLEGGNPAYQMRQTLEAIRELDEQSLVIYPNADAGGRAMIDEIRKFERLPKLQVFPTLGHKDFLSILRISSVLVGNSSSGIIEAPSFGIPVVNIGSRQDGRTRGKNVIESGYDKAEIKSAITYALQNTEFRERAKNAKNPYGYGNSSSLIVDILEKTPITPDLVQKRLAY
jgi:GDP/UDP-N,N'-diacetylbacillosamine 2-epimerase (hydrolysing)